MRLRFLIACLTFLCLSCIQAISNSDLHRNLSSEQMQTQPPSENYGRIKEEMRLNREDEVKQEVPNATIKKAHGGRGAGGGNNVDHTPRRSVNSAMPPSVSRSSTVFLGLALMVMMLFFQFKLL